ncbi:MAG: glycosyltransferase family 87 protein [Janthinobacterium lividum]
MSTLASPLAVSEATSLPPRRSLLKLLIFVFLVMQVAFCWTGRGRSMHGDVDLRAFYAAGAMVRDGQRGLLYDSKAERELQQQLFHGEGRDLPFLYPAFAALPFAVLSACPYPTAFGLMFVLNLGCLFASAVLLRRQANLSWSSGWMFAGFLAFFPTIMALMQGQISGALLLCLTGFYVLVQKEHHFYAGLCLSAMLVKFQIALPLCLLYLVWRHYRLVAGFAIGATTLAGLSFGIAGRVGTLAYVARLRGVGMTMSAHPEVARSLFGMQASAEPNLHGLLTTLGAQGMAGAAWTALASLAVLLWVSRQKPGVAVAVPAAMLMSYHMQPYDLVLLLLPLALLLLNPSQPENDGDRLGKWVGRASVLTLVAPVAPYLLVTEETVWLVLPVAACAWLAGQREALTNAPMPLPSLLVLQ